MEQALETREVLASGQLDDLFLQIRGLTWLPWVGKQFLSRPTNGRLLIVGESHYYKTEREREERRDINYTKDVIWEQPVNCWWEGGNRTLDNIPKLLFKTAALDRRRFWRDTSYYNFVQRLMDYSREEQPAPADFIAGWGVFVEVLKLIQPSHCLFIGVSAAKTFDHSMSQLNVTFENVSYIHQVGRTWARVAKLDIVGTITKIIFVQHLGKYFSWVNWHGHLQAHHADLMNWLQAESYTIVPTVCLSEITTPATSVAPPRATSSPPNT